MGEAVTSWGESRRGPKRPINPVGHIPGSFSQALGPVSWSVGQCSLRGVSLAASGGSALPREPGRTQATSEPLYRSLSQNRASAANVPLPPVC